MISATGLHGAPRSVQAPGTAHPSGPQVSASSALVVLGSSLTVMSGLRYIRHASSLGIPVLIVNQGTTRGDDLATARLDAPLGATLTALARKLGLADDSLSVA